VKSQTVDVSPLCIRADVAAVSDENRTVELIFSTGAAVERFDWSTGQRYLEKLSLKAEHIKLDRLNSGGAPLLDSHSAWSLSDQIGVVEPDSVRLTAKEARATVRFSKRAEVEPIWQDVRDGIIKNVSIGYRVYKFEEEKASGNRLAVRTAVEWEPFEVSMVTMPADAGARVRSGDKSNTNSCVIVTHQETKMSDEIRSSETIVEQNPLIPATPATTPAPEPNEQDAARDAERSRIQGIIAGCRAARLPQSYADRLIADGVTLVDAQTRILQELAARGNQNNGPTSTPTGSRDLIVGEDPLVHVRAGVENALLHRMHPYVPASGKLAARGFQLTEEGRQYRGMTLLDVAKAYLSARGIRVTGLSKIDVAGVALGLRGGHHTTSDFANLLADLPNKILRQAYLEAPQTFGPIVRMMTLADFKKSRLLQLGEAPALLEVGEHGEYTDGTIGESKEEIQLKTYGRKFSITRQALVNDDTDAFSRVPMAFGRQARNKESDLVWTEITANAAMGDGVTLFHSTHANLSGTSDAIAVASIGAGRTAMRRQTGIDAVTLMNLEPKTLIVPATKETLADQFVSTALLASQSSNVNPFGGKLAVVAEPRLDVNSTVSWYLAASPDQIDIIVLATLEGESGPRVDSRIGFDVDGVEIKISHDIAAKVVDFRGLWKNPGA
jgi:hypothetical protein